MATLHLCSKMPKVRKREVLMPKFPSAPHGVSLADCFRLDDAELSFQFQGIPKARNARAAYNHGHRSGLFDVGHSSADNSNRRTKPKKYAVWEIHPVMALQIDQ